MGEQMRIEYVAVGELKPYENNPRRNEGAVEAVMASIQEFGFKVPIVITGDNVIIAGHTRIKAAERLGLEEVPCIRAEDLDDEQIRAFRLADNKTAELAEWDEEKLQEELDQLDRTMMELMGFEFDDGEDEVDELYTKKVQTPVYEPTGDVPEIDSLMDAGKRDQLAAEVLAAGLPDDVEAFLLEAANRHVVFNYKNIAEYYAHAEPEVQKLFEDSALVIIDYDRAIELGYVKLSSRLSQIMLDSMGEADG